MLRSPAPYLLSGRQFESLGIPLVGDALEVIRTGASTTANEWKETIRLRMAGRGRSFGRTFKVKRSLAFPDFP
jgi:hypothetical protein